MKKKKAGEWLPVLLALTLAALACLSIWYMRHYYRVEDMTRVKSVKGVYDLTGINLDRGFVRLEGEVAYIPGILTPSEFSVRGGEAQVGNPWDLTCATSRILIRVPESKSYTITAGSVDFAHRVYVNGEWRYQAGTPAEAAADFIPGCGQMTLEVTPKNGVIELVQQGANFVHREGGGHSNIYFGNAQNIQTFLAQTFGPEYVVVGLFALLFLVHLILFIISPAYRPNLYFSLLCVTWMVRSGVTGAKVFYAVFPGLSWQLAFRAEYLSMPLAAIFMVLLIRELFPGVAQRLFIWIITGISAAFSMLCLFMDTVPLSWMIMVYEGCFTLAIIYLCIRFAMKAPGMIKGGSFRIEHAISLTGLAFFMVAAVNDALYHAGVLSMLGFTIAFSMTGLAMLVFSLFQMTAMLYGTMREAALAHERERRSESEKEMLSEMNRLKSAFYTDMSHEMKTPLTVIAVNAQFAAQSLEAEGADEETITDLNAISDEANRLAQMVTSLVGLGRMQGAEGERIPVNALLTDTARIYQTLFARKRNTLTVEVTEELPEVEGNGDKLAQVLINLLSNANRHTSNGCVYVRGETAEKKGFPGYVLISVTDTGEGISPELMPCVFQRFCHGENGGSGLGLSICKTIIEEHGGEIGIESEIGAGTTVWFTLPPAGGVER